MNGLGPVVIWQVTQSCSAGCSNCAIGATPGREPSELATMECYETIDEIRSVQPSQLILTGGDVFERDDLNRLVAHARRSGLEPSVEVSGTSNLTQAAVQGLARAGARGIVIGLDGIQASDHESVRGSRNTFEATVAAAGWAHQAGLQVEVNTMATPKTLAHFAQLATMLEEMAIQRWNIWFPVPLNASRAIPILTAFETEALFALIHAARIERDFGIRVFEAPHYLRFQAQHGPSIRTSVAPEVILITSAGYVSPSPFCELRTGNLRYQPLGTIIGNSALFKTFRRMTPLNGKCGRCEWTRSCGGSRSRALAMTGNVFASDPLCAHQPTYEC